MNNAAAVAEGDENIVDSESDFSANAGDQQNESLLVMSDEEQVSIHMQSSSQINLQMAYSSESSMVGVPSNKSTSANI